MIITAFVLVLLGLGFFGAPFWLWSALAIGALAYFQAGTCALIIAGVIAAIGIVKPIRAILLSKGVMAGLRALKFLPTISDTEKVAIEAGSVWVEGDLFSGKPDLKKLMDQPYPKLTADEQAFMDGPLQKLCGMLDDWQIWKERKLSAEAWDFIRREKFLGMIIPKEYGGLGMSATGHSEVIRVLSSRSLAATIHVMVPNSLGPAELLIHYGTDEQKKRLLPRLANGTEIPCFALTEPTAGSDAGSITAEGILYKGADGKLMLRLSWNKRWITLASISTILGLAFRLKDPENFLGKGPDLGITCALIPTNTPGVIVGDRHDPLGVPFFNCPTHGKNVEVSADVIVGGIENAGKGWQMLMECLSAGRGISFPAQSVGGAQLTTRAVSAHALVRQQFGVSIGRFEGVQEPLSKIVGFNYILEALRCYTLSSLDQGMKPGVVTAIAKYYSTEMAREIINHGMDIMGGAGISLGKRNLLGHLYIAAPIAITVEGANILTRTLMVFGQGALRAHPYAFAEVKALEKNDVKAFDLAFWGHIGHIVRNLFRSVILSVTRGWLTVPRGGSLGIYYRKLAWISASFAIMADIAMGSLGGKLKVKESITGRFADILAYMYIGTAVLRRYEADGAKKEHLPLVHFAMSHVMGKIQNAFDGIFGNLEVPLLTWFFKGPVRIWSGLNTLGGGDVADCHVHKIAELILDDAEIRDHLTKDIYYPTNPDEQLKRLDNAVIAMKKAQVAEHKLKKAVRAKKLTKKPLSQLIEDGVKAGVITADEEKDLKLWDHVRIDAIQVDAFTEEQYHAHKAEY